MIRLLLVSLVFLQACAPASSNSGRAIYSEKCAVCHGISGKGDGPLAAQMSTRVPDLTQIAARRDGVWPMLEVMSIVDGYSSRFLPDTEMPIYDEFLEGRLVPFDTGNGIVQQTPADLLSVTLYLESIQDPQPTRAVP